MYKSYNAATEQNGMPVQPFHWAEGSYGWDILRLDQIHPIVSGNKSFKLSPFLKIAMKEGKKGLLTFGGPYSNHIHATAFAASESNLESIGIIRGERTDRPSSTLQDAEKWGMRLIFVSRKDFLLTSKITSSGQAGYGDEWLLIPQGGYSPEGAKGASFILQDVDTGIYDRIVCACGTGTTYAGLRMSAQRSTKLTGIAVLKGYDNLLHDICQLLPAGNDYGEMEILHNYHFGGYAKYNAQLTGFMNWFYERSGIPTDFVYTAKLMFAVNDLFSQGVWNRHEKVLVIHSGGLQGNRSLQKDILRF